MFLICKCTYHEFKNKCAVVCLFDFFVHMHTLTGQIVRVYWNGVNVANNSLVTLSAVQSRVTDISGSQFPLMCQGIAGGQWYQPNGVLYPLPIATPGGYGQRNVSAGVELYSGTPSDFPHGVQCCTNTSITLCVGMYTDLTLASSVNLSATNYALSVAATCKYRGKHFTYICILQNS